MKKVLVATLLLLAAAWTPAQAQEEFNFKVDDLTIGFRYMQVPDGEAPPFLPSQDNKVNTVANQCCFFSTPQCTPTGIGSYTVGQQIVVSNYWRETVAAAGAYAVTFSFGVKPTGMPTQILINNMPFNFTLPSAGTFTFCIFATGTLPPASPTVSPFLTGYRVTTPGGTIPHSAYGAFVVQ